MKTDDLKYILNNTTELIRNIDNKNSIMVAIMAGLAVMLFSNGEFLTAIVSTLYSGISLHLVIFFALFLSFIVFLVSLFLSILPRDKFIKRSLIYAGSISEYQNYDSYKSDLNNQKYDFTDDLANQIFINSRIYRRKTRCSKIAYWSLLFLITAIVLFALIPC